MNIRKHVVGCMLRSPLFHRSNPLGDKGFFFESVAARLIVGLLLLSVPEVSMARESYSLFRCWEMATNNYPLIKGKAVLAENARLDIKNIRIHWLPQLELSGLASWQSDVPAMNMESPLLGTDLPGAPKDQYKLTLEVSETLYDGGRTQQRVGLREIEGKAEMQDIEIQMLEVRKIVADLFFGALMMQQMEEQMVHKIIVLEKRRSEMEDAFVSGTISKGELKRIDAEILMIKQQLVALERNQNTLLTNLSSFVGEEISSESALIAPSVEDVLVPDRRPEYDLFQIQRSQLEKSIELHQRDRWPVLAAFGQAGYGNPGLNMLTDEFDTFYMVGLNLKWSPWDWKGTRRDIKVLKNKVSLVDLREETFQVNQMRSLNRLNDEIVKYLEMMELDGRLVELRKGIEEESAGKLQYGTITPADYLVDLDAYTNAMTDKELHSLEYLYGMTRKYLTGEKHSE